MLKETFPEDVLKEARQRGIELASANDRMGGGLPIYLTMLRAFLKEARQVPGKLTKCLADGLWVEAYLLMHMMKGSAGIMGATRLAQLCGQLEKELKVAKMVVNDKATIQEILLELDLTIDNLNWIAGQLEVKKSVGKASGPPCLDMEKVKAKLAQLANLLRQGDMSAMDVFSEINEQKFEEEFEGKFGEHFVALDDAIISLNFELALIHCEKLSSELKNSVTQDHI